MDKNLTGSCFSEFFSGLSKKHGIVRMKKTKTTANAIGPLGPMALAVLSSVPVAPLPMALAEAHHATS